MNFKILSLKKIYSDPLYLFIDPKSIFSRIEGSGGMLKGEKQKNLR